MRILAKVRACVEDPLALLSMQTPALDWRKASFCQNGECIEVAAQNGVVVMRNHTQTRPDSAQIYIYSTTEEFHSFLSGVKAGEFDDLAGSAQS